jgi:hypothetical protein
MYIYILKEVYFSETSVDFSGFCGAISLNTGFLVVIVFYTVNGSEFNSSSP